MRRQLGERGRDRLGAPLALLQPLPLLRQPLFLVRPRRQGGQFIDRVAQPFLVALRRGDRFARGLQRGDRLPPGAPGADVGIAQRPRHAERIQQRGMARRIGQADLLVLALHLHQQRSRPAAAARRRPAGR